MNKLRVFLLTFGVMLAGFAAAQVIPSLPYNLTNGTIADANQVMANFNQIVSSTNTNAANAGANTNITALLGLTTPLAPSVGGSPVYTAGVSGGTLNAQTVLSPTPSGYVLAAGRLVIFIAGFTNNGAMTLNVNSTGPITVMQHSQAGLVPLAGGEVVATQATVVYYDGTQYQLFDSSPQALVSPCTEIDYRGLDLPSGYLLETGAAVARATYVNLFACMTRGTTASTVNGSASVTVPNSLLFQVGWFVGGANVTCNSTISSIPDTTHIVLNNPAGATGATTLVTGPYRQGDCSTTFNIPNAFGRVSASVEGAGGTVLTTATCALPQTLGQNCGTETKTLLAANLPPVTSTNGSQSISVAPDGTGSHWVAVSNGGQWTYIQPANAASGAAVASTTPPFANNTVSFSGVNSISVTSTGTSSTPVSSLLPISLVQKAIKF